MPLVKVRKCPFSGQLFEEAEDYAKHLRRMRRHNHDKYYLNSNKKIWIDYLREKRNTLIGMDAIFEWISEDMDNILPMIYKARMPATFASYDKDYDEWVGKNFKFGKIYVNHKRGIQLKYRAEIATTHDAPINGIKSNMADRSTPYHYYEGFDGDFKAEFEGRFSFGILSVLRVCAIHISCGGGDYGQFHVYLDDWPAWKEHIEHERTASKLRGVAPCLK